MWWRRLKLRHLSLIRLRSRLKVSTVILLFRARVVRLLRRKRSRSKKRIINRYNQM